MLAKCQRFGLALLGAASTVASPTAAWAQAPVPAVEWLKLLGPWGAALLAGAFGLFQLARRQRFERDADDRRREADALRARADAERARALEFKVKQLEPVMDALNRTVVQSYTALMAPQAYGQLVGVVPILRREETRATSAWLDAMGELSDLRMRLMLSIARRDVPVIMQLLTEQAALGIELQDARNRFFAGHAQLGDIARVHREYVRKSFELMLALRDTLLGSAEESAPLSEAERRTLAESLALPFERASAVTISYGGHKDAAWVCSWQTSRVWLDYATGRENKTAEDFETVLIQLAKALREQLSGKLDVNLAMMRPTDDDASATIEYVLAVTFASDGALEAFVGEVLPALKAQTPLLWTGYLAPSEFAIKAART